MAMRSLDAIEETSLRVSGYRDAMTYVLQLSTTAGAASTKGC